MTAVTYTALRSITRTSFEAQAKVDISTTVSTIDSVAGEFLGVNSGEWVLVTGFTNAANNGWHQLSVASTTTTITVTSTLVVEAAGDSVTILGYLRGNGQLYSIDVKVKSMDRKRVVDKAVSKSIDGTTESVLNYSRNNYIISTTSLTGTAYDQFIEFLDSCENREPFSFDKNGTVASPSTTESAKITSNGYQEARFSNTGDRVAISFALELI